jgi:L-threonylcarbamoyladenylate synthase
VPVEIIPVDPDRPQPEVITIAAEALLRGSVIGFPTDTFYGLGCSLIDVAAVEMLFRLKRRPAERAIISLIDDPQQVDALADNVPDVARVLMRRFWPGPLSLVFRASPLVPAGARGPRDSVALRWPDHALSIALVRAVGGPIVASSANLSGQPPARTAAEVARVFGNQLALVLDGGAARAEQPSTLADVSRGRVEVLRPGAIDLSEYVAARGGEHAPQNGARLPPGDRGGS